MSISTRAGDDGTSGLIGEGRYPKSDPRFEALGDLDELNAWLGSCAGLVDEGSARECLAGAQRWIIAFSAVVATVPGAAPPPFPYPDELTSLEAAIAECESVLPPLRTLILPGGCPAGAALHIARAVCRRAERRVVALGDTAPSCLAYLNRLSDYLFVLARRVNLDAGTPEEPHSASPSGTGRPKGG